MFGQNPKRKQNLDPQGMLVVQDIFRTIQGEGPHAGEPAIFVRLAGCNLQCWFCDTDFESKARPMSAAEVMAEVRSKDIESDLVVITGGEPLMQNIAPLCQALIDDHYHVQLETAGTLWVPGLHQEVEIICSPKTGKINPTVEERCWHYKYIIQASPEPGAEDGLPLVSTQVRGKEALLYRPPPGATVWVQPMDEGDPDRNKANLDRCLWACYQFGYRLSFQIHKAIGVE